MEYPDKGKDVLAWDENGNQYNVFRCACKNINCKEWRCSLTGYHMTINIIKWLYIEGNES